MMQKCQKCRKEIKMVDRFCPYCGAENPAFNPKYEEMETFIHKHIGKIMSGICVIGIILVVLIVKISKSDPLDKYTDLAHYVETNTKSLTAEEMGVPEDYFENKTEPAKPMKIWEPTPTPRPTPIPTPVHIMTQEEMDAVTLPILGKE